MNTLQKSSAFNLEMKNKTRLHMLSKESILKSVCIIRIQKRTSEVRGLLKNAPKKKI